MNNATFTFPNTEALTSAWDASDAVIACTLYGDAIKTHSASETDRLIALLTDARIPFQWKRG